MATHPIGEGKVIVGVPMDLELSRDLGRRAFELDISKAALMRKLLRAYLAGKVALCCLLAACGLGAVISYSATGYHNEDLIRAARRVRGRRRDQWP